MLELVVSTIGKYGRRARHATDCTPWDGCARTLNGAHQRRFPVFGALLRCKAAGVVIARFCQHSVSRTAHAWCLIGLLSVAPTTRMCQSGYSQCRPGRWFVVTTCTGFNPPAIFTRCPVSPPAIFTAPSTRPRSSPTAPSARPRSSPAAPSARPRSSPAAPSARPRFLPPRLPCIDCPGTHARHPPFIPGIAYRHG